MRPMWVWGITAVLLAAGASWLVALVWKTSMLDGVAFGPPIVGAALGGLTLARFAAFRRRWHAPALAIVGTVLWIGVRLADDLIREAHPMWSARFDGSPWSHYAIVGALAIAAATATASLRLRPMEHGLEWIWVSGLLMLGTMVLSFLASTDDRSLPAVAIVAMLASPMFAGALTQYLAPRRMIWTCGSGALLFVLLALDQGGKASAYDLGGTFLGCGIFILLGALGARIAWALFPRKPAATELPPARAT